MSSMLSYSPSTLFLCANTERLVDGKSSPCGQPAPNVCKECLLVQYCTKECQVAHWNLHRADCRSPLTKATWKPTWMLEQRNPSFATPRGGPVEYTSFGGMNQKYLWGNMPALDVLNVGNNEQDSLPQNLHLLFAASGDIRNVVKSLVALPTSYAGQCEVIINDRDIDVVARNAIMLLIAFHFSPSEATPMMLHIWYSAFITQRMLESLQEKLLPLIQDVCVKIRDKQPAALQSKSWKHGKSSLRLVLQKSAWDTLPSYLQVPDDLSATRARELMVATTLAPERVDAWQRNLYNKPPYWRLCATKFREGGLLVPYGYHRCKEFDTPNPTLFHANASWPFMDSADPLSGWPINEILLKAPPAKNDIYGSLFNHVQDILLKFCHRTQSLEVCFQLFQRDALELPTIIKWCGMDQSYFDRIEVSNIGDRGYLGPERLLATFGPLLKRKAQNSHATLVALFLNATEEVFATKNSPLYKVLELKRASKYVQMTQQDSKNADFAKIDSACQLFRNVDELFQQFCNEVKLGENSRAAGLKMKSTNTVIAPWPLRLKEEPKQKEFDILLASSHTGSERYVEWESLS